MFEKVAYIERLLLLARATVRYCIQTLITVVKVRASSTFWRVSVQWTVPRFDPKIITKRAMKCSLLPARVLMWSYAVSSS